jgi:hypothetical protein
MAEDKDKDKEQKAKETAEKKSKTMQEKFRNDPEFQKLHSQGVVDKWKDPEYRAKISAARKKQWAENPPSTSRAWTSAHPRRARRGGGAS